jgi:hypothetical protein
MTKTPRLAVVVASALVLFASCGSDPKSADTTEPAATTGPAATTAAPTTAAATTTTVAPTTTRAPTTTTAAPTTTADALTAAVVAAGYSPPDAKTRAAFQTLCTAFTSNDADAINSTAAKEPDYVTLVQTGFGVLCPENAPLVGTAVMANGDPVFPGYPLIVDIGTVDRRVANWDKDKTVDGQLVAVAPGVYAVYNPAVPDLLSYLTGPSDGDCAVRHQYFPTGGACWDGVQKGGAEP